MQEKPGQPFLSAAAAGTDWRTVTRAALAQLEGQPGLRACTIGFIYMTDRLSAEAARILDLVRTVTGIAHWTGAVGVGVCANGASHVDEPALVLMAGAIDPALFRVFPAVDLDLSPARAVLAPWLADRDPMLVLLHGDPLSDNDPAHTLAELALEVGGFTAGGLASARGDHVQVADDVVTGGLSGVAFAAEVDVAVTLSQGCAPMGATHVVTRGAENMVMELDGRPAFAVFAEELRQLAATDAARRDGDGGVTVGGDIHVAFPVPGREQRDYLVRDALGLDPERGWIAVGHPVQDGTKMMFVHRDETILQADLARTLVALRERVTREKGRFAPRGALYISCVARAGSAFAGNGEMALVREILGDMPLAGFYANGEIANGHLYGYTAIVILFL